MVFLIVYLNVNTRIHTHKGACICVCVHTHISVLIILSNIISNKQIKNRAYICVVIHSLFLFVCCNKFYYFKMT